MLCSKASLQSLAQVQKHLAVPFAKTWGTMHAVINALLEGANVPILRHYPVHKLSFGSSCTWPVTPLLVQYFGSAMMPHCIFVNDEEKSSYKTGQLLKAGGLRSVQRRGLIHRINLNLIESWRKAGITAAIAKLNALLKSCQGPFGSQANKVSKAEMYAHLLQTYSAGDVVFTQRRSDFAFDWGVCVDLRTDDYIVDRVSQVAECHLSDGSDVKNTRWMSLVSQYPLYDPAWTSDELAFEHYFELTGQEASISKKSEDWIGQLSNVLAFSAQLPTNKLTNCCQPIKRCQRELTPWYMSCTRMAHQLGGPSVCS